MYIARQTKPTPFSLIISRIFSRNDKTHCRHSSGNSGSSEPNSAERKRETGTPTIHKKIIDKVSKTLNDVPFKVQTKGQDIAKASLDKISGSISAFDDLLGISAVREAQSNVRQAEEKFMSYRKKVQEAEKDLELVRTQLNDVRKRLDRVSRDDERYLSLATEEHTTLLEEKKLKAIHKDWETQERDQFAVLSGIVRESHEKERERVERTKHWSVVGSVVGAAIGVISSSVINYIRLKEVKSSVKTTGEELMENSTKLLNLLSSQEAKLAANSSEIKEVLATHSEEVTNKLTEVRDSIDTYALSASIGTDVGTVEAGITLKTLTEQLRELVQLQLAREREKIERGSEPSDNLVSIHKQIHDVKEENRNNFAEMTVALQSLNSKLVERNSFTEKSISYKNVPSSDLSLENSDQHLQKAQYWSKVQTLASVLGIATSVILLVHELSK